MIWKQSKKKYSKRLYIEVGLKYSEELDDLRND